MNLRLVYLEKSLHKKIDSDFRHQYKQFIPNSSISYINGLASPLRRAVGWDGGKECPESIASGDSPLVASFRDQTYDYSFII